MVEGVQKDINRISPIIGLLDWVAGKLDDRLVDFSVQIARDGAWNFALAYAGASNEEKLQLLKKRDKSITWLGKDLAKPGVLLSMIALFIKLFESKSVKKIASTLAR